MENSKIKESLEIRGVCDAIRNMAFPTIDNLIELLSKVGINLIRKQ